MDDATLTAQYAKTGNLMDLCSHPNWLQEVACIEDECNGQVEAGQLVQNYAQSVQHFSADQMQKVKQRVRLEAILFTKLHNWMSEWELGAGFDAAYAIARKLLRSHLTHLNPAQQEFIDTLLSADAQGTLAGSALQQQITPLLSQLLSHKDWQEIAQAAAQTVSNQVLNVEQQGVFANYRSG